MIRGAEKTGTGKDKNKKIKKDFILGVFCDMLWLLYRISLKTPSGVSRFPSDISTGVAGHAPSGISLFGR